MNKIINQPNYDHIVKVFLEVVKQDIPLSRVFSEVMNRTGCNVMQLRIALDRWNNPNIGKKLRE